jgi:hypothetical protein
MPIQVIIYMPRQLNYWLGVVISLELAKYAPVWR